MTERQERRATGVNRVPVLRLVDICGRDATVPAFEAESVELSGRGIRVRTPYLPPLGAPLVCRLEDAGREIVVEGVVAWQQERNGGGEFGIKFTALDSGSVDALKALCGLGDARADVAPAPEAHDLSEPAATAAPAGAPVKLHIDGLGAPMKARVRTGGTRRKLQVGSNLEFLKVGRGLEVEDVEHGARRGAKIDAVSIAIDPQTQVPQLVVALRYEGEESTPEPSVVGDSDEEASALPHAPPDRLEAASARVPNPDANADGNDESDEDDESGEQFRGRVDAFAVSVGSKVTATGETLGRVGKTAALGFSKFFRAGRERIGEAAQRHTAEKRRSTAPAPVDAPIQRKLRPQNVAKTESDPDGSKRKKIVVAGAAGAVVILVAAMFVVGRSKSAPPPSLVPATAATNGSALLVAPAPAGTLTSSGMPGAGTAQAAANGAHNGVVAHVPLFGPTPMATLEPAPLGPPPDELAATAVAPKLPPVAKSDEFSEPSAGDEEFSDSSSSKRDKGDKGDKSEKSDDSHPEDVKPFVEGRLHLPVIYRLKLDKPGDALEGTKSASGFTVVIPKRKVTESGAAISKRDDRIVDVKTKNSPEGARITFVFHGDKVPPYKVRLRKGDVEFFISSPASAK